MGTKKYPKLAKQGENNQKQPINLGKIAPQGPRMPLESAPPPPSFRRPYHPGHLLTCPILAAALSPQTARACRRSMPLPWPGPQPPARIFSIVGLWAGNDAAWLAASPRNHLSCCTPKSKRTPGHSQHRSTGHLLVVCPPGCQERGTAGGEGRGGRTEPIT